MECPLYRYNISIGFKITFDLVNSAVLSAIYASDAIFADLMHNSDVVGFKRIDKNYIFD